MSNQNLNSLTVKTLNYTADYLYHRGRQIQSFPIDASGTGHGGDLCLDHLGIGPTNPCTNHNFRLDVCGNVQIYGSTAMGNNNTATSGQYSTAMGGNTTASGLYSTAMGYKTKAKGEASTAMGVGTDASGNNSTAMGYTTTASGGGSTAMGNNTSASGDASTVMGSYSLAAALSPPGIEGTIAMGNRAYAGVDICFAIGADTNPSSTLATDISNNNKFVILQSGNVGIGTSAPLKTLDVSGTIQCKQFDCSGIGNTVDISGTTTLGGTTTINGVTTLNDETYIKGYLDASGTEKHFGGKMFDNNGKHGGINFQVPMSTAAGWVWADISGNTINTSLWHVTATSGNNIYFDGSGTPGVGRVGIDTASPQQALDVSGNVVIRGTLDVSGNMAIDGTINTLTVGLGGGSVSSNTAVGFEALKQNTAGVNNVALGYQALKINTTGVNNVATGIQALYSNGDGGGNVATGIQALFQHTDGQFNTATGSSALTGNFTGNKNVATGYNAGNGQTNFNNTINIGAETSCNAHNTACIGNADISCVYLGSISGLAKLDCSGIISSGDATINGLTVGLGGGNNITNTAIGDSALGKSGVHSNPYNTAIGYHSLFSNTIGSNNVAIGSDALADNIEGGYNVAIGVKALQQNTTGNNNVATGYQALFSNVGGRGNVATGYHTLHENSGGIYNVATGFNALHQNTTGNYNVATGFNALQNNTTGYNNTAIGNSALQNNTTGYNNTAIGNSALNRNILGVGNIATGFFALNKNIGGSYNVATGFAALQDNSGGDYNIATGFLALNKNIGGSYNVATGFRALEDNSENASGNIATGYYALNKNTSGSYNVAVGYQALQNNLISIDNVAIGREALLNNTEQWNVAIGSQAGKGQTNFQNTINIGFDTSCNDSNTACIGNQSITTVYLGSTSGSAKLDCSGIVSSGLVETTDISCSMISAGGNVGSDDKVLSQTGGIIEWVDGTSVGSHWTTDGSNVWRSSGNVGIGTSAPATVLDVSGDATINGNLDLSCNKINDVSGIYFCDGSSFTTGNSLDISANGISFITNGKEQMKILSTGQVGIGVTNPTMKLEVSDISCSALYAGGTQGVSGQVLHSTGSGIEWVTGTSVGSYWSQDASNIYFDTGNVGIGVSNPTTALDVVGNIIIEAVDTSNFWIDVSSTVMDKWTSITSSNNGIYLSAVVYGGNIWNSTDSGLTWTPVSPTLTENWISITSEQYGLARSAVAYGGNIWNSTDSGLSWSSVAGTTRNWHSISMSTTYSGIYINAVVSGGNIWNSTDKGLTWTEVSPGGSTKNWYSIKTGGWGNYVNACVYGGNIWNSTDKGSTWTEVSPAMTENWRSISGSRAASSVHACVYGGHIWNSSDYGVTWTEVSTDTSKNWISIISNLNGNILAAVVEGGNIWRSTDYGLTWTEVNGGANKNWHSITSDDSGMKLVAGVSGEHIWIAHYILPIALNVSNSDATINGLTVGLGGGGIITNTAVGDKALQNNYTHIASHNYSKDNTAIGFHALNKNYDGYQNTAVGSNALFDNISGKHNVAVGYNAGKGQTEIYNTINIGNDASCNASNTACIGDWYIETVYLGSTKGWAKLDCSGIVSSGFVGIGTNTIPAAAWTSRATSKNWRHITSSSDGTKLVAVVDGGNIWTSPDSGLSWIERPFTPSYWSGITSSSDGTKLAAVVDGGYIWRSTDSGVSWGSTATSQNWSGITSSFDGTKLAAVVDGGFIWRSTDSGVSWVSTATSQGWSAITSSFDGTKLAAVVDGGYIWRSTDSGVSWTNTAEIRQWMAITSSADGTKLAATVKNEVLWTSTDSGVSWIRDYTIINTHNWYGITSNYNGTKLAAVVDGGYVWTLQNAVTAPTFLDVSGSLQVQGDITATGDIISNFTSDIRFKTNIKKIKNPLEKLSKINGYTYNWIESDLHPYNGEDTGVIAQEVETIDLPGVSVTRESGYKGVKYERLIPLLLESIKSLQETNIKQQKQINQLMENKLLKN